MTVRKWIDRSIAGLETRSGDYPVMNTKNVAIIIMLSGLENIPRITELKEIQIQYKTNHQDSIAGEKLSGSDTISVSEGTGSSSNGGAAKVQDESRILPLSAHKKMKSPQGDYGRFSDQEAEEYLQEIETPPPLMWRKISSEPETAEKKTPVQHITKPQIIEEVIPQIPSEEGSPTDVAGSPAPRHRVVVAKEQASQTPQSAPVTTSFESSGFGIPPGKKSSHTKDSRGFDEKHLPHTSDDRLRTKETERQIIERELQRQRMMAISGRTSKTGSKASTYPAPSPEIVRIKHEVTDKTSRHEEQEKAEPGEVVHTVHKKRTVIIQKKKVHPVTRDTNIPDDVNGDGSIDDDRSVIKRHTVYSRQMNSEESKVSIKNSAYKSKDEVFEGKGVRRPAAPQVRDSALLHTDLKSKKNIGESKGDESDPGSNDHVTESSKVPKKREKTTTKKDDISWI
jgi:tubulin-like protein CetZ